MLSKFPEEKINLQNISNFANELKSILALQNGQTLCIDNHLEIHSKQYLVLQQGDTDILFKSSSDLILLVANLSNASDNSSLSIPSPSSRIIIFEI